MVTLDSEATLEHVGWSKAVIDVINNHTTISYDLFLTASRNNYLNIVEKLSSIFLTNLMTYSFHLSVHIRVVRFESSDLTIVDMLTLFECLKDE